MLGLGSFEQDLKKQTQAFSGMSPPQLNQIANPTQKTRPDPNKGITPDLLKALAAQRLLKQKQAAENDMKASMEKDPRTVVQQQEEELQGLSLRETQSNVDKALANKQRQKNKTQTALNKLNPAQIAAMRNVSPSNPITRPLQPQNPRRLQDPRRAGIARAPVPRKMGSAQGGIVGYSNGGGIKKFNQAGPVKNDPYGIGALGNLYTDNFLGTKPRFDYSTNQDRSLLTLLKNILKGGMLKPEGGSTNTNVQPEVSNDIRPFVPINTGESAKDSLARRAAEKEQRGIDEQLNLLRQSQDSSMVDNSQLLSSTTSQDTKFGDQTDPKNRFPGSNLNYGGIGNRQLLSSTNAGDKNWWDWLTDQIGGEDGTIIKRKTDSPEKDGSGEETGPEIIKKPELGDGSEKEEGPNINTDGGDSEVPADPTNDDSDEELRSKIQTYDNLLGIDVSGDPLQKLITSMSRGIGQGQVVRQSLKYDNMIINRKLAAQDLLIRREANNMRLEGVRLTVLQDTVADLTKLLADKREEVFATGDFTANLALAEADLEAAHKSQDQQQIKAAKEAYNNILKQVESIVMGMHSDIYAKLEAYENELKRRFGMSTATPSDLTSEIDFNQKPELN
jgi:hypothetical protein